MLERSADRKSLVWMKKLANIKNNKTGVDVLSGSRESSLKLRQRLSGSPTCFVV
jgi:hypothetical protein